MTSINISWDPTGTLIDALGANKFLTLNDEDTSLQFSIRMLSIHTLEIRSAHAIWEIQSNDVAAL